MGYPGLIVILTCCSVSDFMNVCDSLASVEWMIKFRLKQQSWSQEIWCVCSVCRAQVSWTLWCVSAAGRRHAPTWLCSSVCRVEAERDTYLSQRRKPADGQRGASFIDLDLTNTAEILNYKRKTKLDSVSRAVGCCWTCSHMIISRKPELQCGY